LSITESNLVYRQESCRLCKKTDLSKILELKPTPAGNNFLTREEKLKNDEPIFPLELYFCKSCYHLQLGHVVNPNHLFKDNYHFVSGTSQVNVNHFEHYAEEVVSRFKLKKNSFIVDIGSNDGTCLKAFKNRGMRVLGIDAAKNIAKIANDNGIETKSAFFSKQLALNIKKQYGAPDLITSHNALAHIEDFSGVIDAVASLMDQKSIFIFEVGYFLDVFQNLWFDTIYHEHLDYHTVAPLKKFFRSMGMELFDAKRIDIQGGSIRNFVQMSKGRHQKNNSIEELILLEKNEGLTNVSDLKVFQSRIDYAKDNLSQLLRDIKERGGSIAGYGAPTKSTTLMNYFELDKGLIDYIIDDNPLKQDKYSPLLHIPVVSSDHLLGDSQPDYLLILAWNFAESIIEKVKNSNNFTGKYIIPLPNAKIV
jgi:SAM-dependent methyltransferase